MMSSGTGSGSRRGGRHRAGPQRDVTLPERRLDDVRIARRVAGDPGGNRRKSLAALAVLVLLILVIGVPALGVWSVFFRSESDVAPGKQVTVEIPEGSGTAAIGGILADAGVIDNASYFRLRARYEDIDEQLRPGVYDLVTGMPYEDVVDRLRNGIPVGYTEVTIPEGFTVTQIAERLEAEVGIPAAEFTAIATTQAASFAAERPYLADVKNGTLEGYLFPKRYRIVEGSTARDVVELMLKQFDTEMATVDLSFAASKNLTKHDVVIIASMIEREAHLATERPLVSSVIYNRLREGMKLQIDATIKYLLPGASPQVTYDNLEIDSPYNTYRYAGLPIGPIASPGLDSLKAAAAPADTKYLFYVLTGQDGSHTFTETYAEFLRAKNK